MRSRNFLEAELVLIDRAYRAGETVRCPEDSKPLVSSTWQTRASKMVYFVCRACGRLGAVGYESADPSVPGQIARASRVSEPPKG